MDTLVQSRVLIVDDNTDLAETMSMVLGICGFETATAHNGRTGVEKARDFHPTYVLLDIGLPDINGYEVASRLRREHEFGDLNIIAISAGEPDDARAGIHGARFNHYLTKPVDVDRLLRILSN